MNHQELKKSADETFNFFVRSEWQNTGYGVQWIPVGPTAPRRANTEGIWRPTPPNQGHWFSHR